ncbi:hypothetical protein NDU88_003494 [Pleurodeles waltl]|uniref:Uncharacterized protein n=1 Tax=Pleurodeles waltl TaxID=8319 RepID=A0AAV7NGK0_PLEWA|nr:hypothetical protein NDU88_003494 [Pleurodeles waltl]
MQAAIPHTPREPRMPCACSTDRCRCFTASWRYFQGLRPRGQAAEGTTGRIERRICPGTTLFFLSIECNSCCFLGTVFGGWSVVMAPKPIRTPRYSRAWHNPDPGGSQKGKKTSGPRLEGAQ